MPPVACVGTVGPIRPVAPARYCRERGGAMRIIARSGPRNAMRNPQPESPVLSIGARLPGDPGVARRRRCSSRCARTCCASPTGWRAIARSRRTSCRSPCCAPGAPARRSKTPSAARPWLLDHRAARARPALRAQAPGAGAAGGGCRDPRRARGGAPRTICLTLRQAIMRLPLEYREPLVLQVLGGLLHGGDRARAVAVLDRGADASVPGAQQAARSVRHGRRCRMCLTATGRRDELRRTPGC